MTFKDKLIRSIKLKNSYVCVGLDTDPGKIPKHLLEYENPTLEFNKRIINATSGKACAFKVNSAFYESHGTRGLDTLIKTFDCLPDDVVRILDAKRGDIGSTSTQYARASFVEIGADAVTVNPYMGFDSVEPFLKSNMGGVILLCLTSNKGSEDFQQLELKNGGRVYGEVARKIKNWERAFPGNIALVVGATHPNELLIVRNIVGDLPILIPGVGAQAGDLEATVKAGIGEKRYPAMINSSRGIIYSSSGKDFAEAAAVSCGKLRDSINSLL